MWRVYLCGISLALGVRLQRFTMKLEYPCRVEGWLNVCGECTISFYLSIFFFKSKSIVCTRFRDFLPNNGEERIKLNEWLSRGTRREVMYVCVYKSVWYSEPSRCTCALPHENAISLISLAGTQPGPHASLHNNKCSGSLSSLVVRKSPARI